MEVYTIERNSYKKDDSLNQGIALSKLVLQ